MTSTGHAQALERVRRVRSGFRLLVEGLMGQLQALEAQTGAPEAVRAAMCRELRGARSRLLEDYWRLERQSAELGRLYTASCRLHSSLEADDVLQAIHEVASELTGCGELAVYELDEGRGALQPIAAFGVRQDALSTAPLGRSIAGYVAASGSAWVQDPEDVADAGITACAPLKSGDRAVGVIAWFGPLAPEVPLEDAFALLKTQAAAVLLAARLQAPPRVLRAV